jgi:hypothetical protein
LPSKTISYSDIQDLVVRDPAGKIQVATGLCQSVAYDTWVSRPGRYFLPSDFTLVRITRFLLTRSSYFNITNFKFSSLDTVLGSKAKKI